MRTTLTLDPEVAAQIKALMHEQRATLKATINELLRRGLAAQERFKEQAPFVVTPHAGGFKPGVDLGRLNQLLDDLDVADVSAVEPASEPLRERE